MTTRNVAEPASDGGGLVRLRLDIAYDGTGFSGWARQPGRRTVEQTITDALALALRLEQAAPLTVAGRTDAGVHATGQVAHVDVPADADLDGLLRRLAGLLPADVVVRAVTKVPPAFDARFSALARHYRYRIADRERDPLRRHDTLWSSRPLDAEAMNDAAQLLLGEHDFAAYCRPREGATTVRTLRTLRVARDRDDVVVVEAVADAFCHNQVRAMVGALIAVGEGRQPVNWPRRVLDARVRDSAVTVASPHGLTLVRVDYPADTELAAQAVRARVRRSL